MRQTAHVKGTRVALHVEVGRYAATVDGKTIRQNFRKNNETYEAIAPDIVTVAPFVTR